MFEETKLYKAGDEALLVIGKYQKLAMWRHLGRGPAYIKIGKSVRYRGSDLNEWLDRQTVRPAQEQVNA